VSPSLAEALAARTEALCAVPSPIGAEKALCDVLEGWARGRGFGVRRVENSIVVRVDPEAGAAGRPLVALCGHLDTVPVHEADRGPPRRDGGRIVAPGASDMKSGVAVALELAERMARQARFADLALVLYSREEGPYLENELGPVLERSPELRAAAPRSRSPDVRPTRPAPGRGRTPCTGPGRCSPSWPGAPPAR